jgi:signal transduction histidine kinase
MQNWVFVVALVATAAISAGISHQAWKRRPAPGSTYYGLIMAAVALWSLLYMLQIASSRFEIQVLLMKSSYIAIANIPVFWLLFVLTYTRRDRWLSRRKIALLFVLPATTLVLIATNDAHGLVWSSIQQVNQNGVVWLTPVNNSWFWVHTLYSYVALGMGALLIIYTLMGGAHLYKYQGWALLAAFLVPMIGNFSSILNLRPLPYLDITPFTFTISGLAIMWGIYRYQLFDIIPAARDLVLDNIQEGIIVFDTDNRLVDANPAARVFLKQSIPGVRRLIGMHKERVLGRWPGLLEQLGDSTDRVEVGLDIAGEIRFFDLHLSPIRNRNGAIGGQVLSISDVTARHAAENLRMEKEAAEAARRAQNAFLASMSHELRTPLNHIIGYSELLMEEAPELEDDELLADLKKIHTSARHLLGLIGNVLEFSKLEAGMVKVEIETVNAALLLQDAALAIQPKLAARNNQLEWDESAALGMIETDQGKLRQILLNLLDNAAKFTENGYIQLRAERSDGWITFRIIDSGIGMTADQVADLFKPFHQVDGSTARRYDGAGLGLATSQRLCHLIDGTLTVDSEPGRGSTFTVQIPAGQIPIGSIRASISAELTQQRINQ